jgi:hypothetical protein
MWLLIAIGTICYDLLCKAMAQARAAAAVDDAPLIQHVNGNGNGNGIGQDQDGIMEDTPCCCGWFVVPAIGRLLLHISTLSYSAIVKSSLSLLQCRPSTVDDDTLVMFAAGSVECYDHWYHVMAFLMLPVAVLFPFGLASIARLAPSSSRKWRPVRRAITIAYRHDPNGLVSMWGECVQYLRRFLLVVVSTFIQSFETVYIPAVAS